MATSHTDLSSSGMREVDGWIMIEKTHTKDREPQYNEDNLSQKELAPPSSEPNSLPDLGHEPGSQGTSSEGDESVDTVTDANLMQEGDMPDLFAAFPLTKKALDLTNRQPGGYPQEVFWWLNNAGPSFRVLEPYSDSIMDDTMLTSTVLASTGSIISSDIAGYPPIDPSSHDFREIGSWV